MLTLLAEWPDAKGLGTDMSEPALAVAKANAATLGADDGARFVLADWWDGIEGQFDLVVANPPYISSSEMADLAPEVRDWEPHAALTPGGDGLAAYRAIAAGLHNHLAPQARVLLEIGSTQGAAVQSILEQSGFTAIAILPDMDGRDRVIEIQT